MDTLEMDQVTSERPGQPGDSCVMVIFGASGDLTKRKLIPALYNVAKDNFLPERFAVIGIARSEMTSEEFREKITRDVEGLYKSGVDAEVWRGFADRLYYLTGSGTDEATFH